MGRDRILVVDDDPDNRAMIGHFLTNWGYEVDDARNGVHALEKIEADPPSLVLLDLEMPEMDGFETCERLKTNPDTEWIPVIIFTGLEKMPHRVRGFRHGADDYLVKTVEPEELRTRIDLVLKRCKRYASLASPSAQGPSAESAPAPSAPASTSSPTQATSAASSARATASATESVGELGEPGENTTLSVSLSKIPFPEAMRLVLAHGKNGIVELEDSPSTGRIHIEDGKVVHAELDGATGDDAFYGLALWRHGRFDFRDGEVGSEKSIQTATRRLLTEASRRHDAWSTISSKVKSFDHVPKWLPLTTRGTPRLTRSDWAILRLADGKRSIRQIVDVLRTDIFEAGRVVYSLVTVGVLELLESSEIEDEAFGLLPLRGDASRVDEPFELTASEWKVLIKVDGRRTLGDVRELIGAPPAPFMKVVKSLKEKGFLRLAGREHRRMGA